MKTLKLLIFGTLFLFMGDLSAQVTGVNYQLRYDTDSCRYDALLIINAGSASTVAERIQFNSQYSIVVPTGSVVDIEERFFPLENNQAYTGTDPNQWAVSTTVVDPLADPGFDYYGITPNLNGPTYHYNNLSAGDTVKLFSFAVSPINNCGIDIRMYENGSDPDSGAPGMGGGDFSNGFTMGSDDQLYEANSTVLLPPEPTIVSLTNECADGVEIDLTASTSVCQGPLTFNWTGPDGFTSTDEDVNITPATPANAGLYSVTITDAFGCTTIATIEATSKPNAGSDETICAGECVTLSGTTPTTGTWSLDPMNVGFGVTLSPLGGGQTELCASNFATATTYNVIYAIPGCSDTMQVTVNPRPLTSVPASDICENDSLLLLANGPGTWSSNDTGVATVNPTTGWAYAVNQGTVTFTFTADVTGCQVETSTLTVNPAPTVTLPSGQDSICIGNFTYVNPTTGGTWASTDPLVASITNGGEVEGLSVGTTYMRFTDATSGCTSDSIEIVVIDVSTVTVTNDSICVGGTTNVLPATGGTWASSNDLVATVDNSGNVVGIMPGFVLVTYTNTATGCVSAPSDTIWVLDAPTVAITGDTEICIGSTSTVSPTTGGTWTSSDDLVATINDMGVVTATGSGPVTFTFVDDVTGCEATTAPIVVDSPPTVSASETTICIGTSSELNPQTGGTWTVLTPGIISLDAAGNTATGTASGEGRLVFNSDATGCYSDTLVITVEPGPTTTLTGPSEICVGATTTFTPTTGGSWSSSNDAIATIENNGTVTGVSPGQVVFFFTSSSTLCQSEATVVITVFPEPVLSIDDTDLCIGDITQANASTFGGTWSSSDDGVASISSFSGEITAVSDGSVTFTYVDGLTGCSAETGILVVNEQPEVNVLGPSEICELETTTVSPTSGGTWSSADEDIATVTNAGVVTGVGPGTVLLTYTDLVTGCLSETLSITVLAATTVSITGDDVLCIDETTQLSPTTGGTWTVSTGVGVASVTNSGLVTALTSGTATFIFTSDVGQCVASETDPIIVNPNPTVIISAPSICVGEEAVASTSTGGMWASTDTSVATIDTITGVITGVAPGTVTFTFTDTITGCPSGESAELVVATAPDVFGGGVSICVGETTSLFPSTGGTWESSDPLVASVTNDGLVTGVSAGGPVTFTFTELDGCDSNPSDPVTVTPGPGTDIGPDDQLCIGEQIQISPAVGGTWVSSDDAVATITDGGLVTAVGQGIAEFTFTSSTTGCSSEATDPVTVNAPATTVVDGPDVICIGGFTQMNPATGGTWISSDDNIATITNGGVVEGIAVGTVTFIFTPDDTGCPSDPSAPVSVSPAPNAEITGLTEICIGANTTLSPSTGGTWTSSDPTVAVVTNAGIVTAIAPGVVNFTFNETATGCDSEASTEDLTITNCLNPDFNATFVDIEVAGNVETNDGTPVGTTYGPAPAAKEFPLGAAFTLTVNTDGTYTFISNMVGVYKWDVSACIPPLASGCQTAELTITVTDFLDPNPRPIANVDIATTTENTAVTLVSLANDKCVVVGGCDLSPAISMISAPSNGSFLIDVATGNVEYTPNAGFVGKDTMTYQVCVLGDPGNCATADQIITILSGSSLNTTAAADDFNSGGQDTPLTGNVSDNDTDAEGDDQLVTPQVVTNAAGTLTLLADGSYTFVPVETFYGPVDFPYLTCDDNATQACADATLHLLIVRDLYVQIRVFLQGSFINNGNEIGTTHTRPLMRDDLRDSPFTGARYIPDEEPYGAMSEQHWETQGDGAPIYFPAYRYTYDTSTVESKFRHIPDPATIFAVDGEDAITDWVHVELRDKSDNTSIIAQRSGLVQRDGDVIDLNGELGLRFPGLLVDDYYVVVKHRNHLGAMTALPQTPAQLADLVDFTLDATGFFTYETNKFPIYDYTNLSQKALSGSAASNKNGYLALWGGDFDANGKIKFTNPDDDINNLFGNVFLYEISPGNFNFFTNFDFAFGYQSGDYDMNSKSKFDNPNDDKNYLFGQLLFYQLNEEFRANFDFFIEQVPQVLIEK